MGEAINDYPFTPTAHIECLQAGDSACELVLGVIELDPPRPRRAGAAPLKVAVYRVIATNYQGSRLRILIWGDRIPEFEASIYRQVIRISRPRVILANPAYADPSKNLMPIELSVQANTIIQILGPIAHEIVPAVQNREILLRDCGNYIGFVIIEAYIRFAIQIQNFGGGSYGSGAVTDGEFHLLVNVSVFDERRSPQVGQHVRISGETRLNRFNTLVLQVQNMDNIQILEDQRMDEARLNNGYRPVPRAPIAPPNVQNPLLNNQQAGRVAAQQDDVQLQQQHQHAGGQLNQRVAGQFIPNANRQLNQQAAGQFVLRGDEQLVQPAAAQFVQPAAGQLVQPAAAQFVQPAAGQLVQPAGAQFVQPAAVQLVQPAAAQFVRPAAGQLVQPAAAQFVQPAAGQFNQQLDEQYGHAAGQLGQQARGQQDQQVGRQLDHRVNGQPGHRTNGQPDQRADEQFRRQLDQLADLQFVQQAAGPFDQQAIDAQPDQQIVEQFDQQPAGACDRPVSPLADQRDQSGVENDFGQLMDNAQLVYLDENSGEIVEVVDNDLFDVEVVGTEGHHDNGQLVDDGDAVQGPSRRSNDSHKQNDGNNGAIRRVNNVSKKKPRVKRIKKSVESLKEPDFPVFHYNNRVIISDTDSDSD